MFLSSIPLYWRLVVQCCFTSGRTTHVYLPEFGGPPLTLDKSLIPWNPLQNCHLDCPTRARSWEPSLGIVAARARGSSREAHVRLFQVSQVTSSKSVTLGHHPEVPSRSAPHRWKSPRGFFRDRCSTKQKIDLKVVRGTPKQMPDCLRLPGPTPPWHWWDTYVSKGRFNIDRTTLAGPGTERIMENIKNVS